MSDKTELAYWDDGYAGRQGIDPVNIKDWRNLNDAKLHAIFAKLGMDGKTVLEIGGGGSQWLTRFALDHKTSQFTCLDYSPEGCDLIDRFARHHKLSNLASVQADMRDYPSSVMTRDIVYSLGVAEHFTDLAEILGSMKRYLSTTGTMVTVIPNMAGITGRLTRHFNADVYNIHVPHDLASFEKGHRDAELSIVESGYLGSSNFGILSSCFTDDRQSGYNAYKWLSRLTKLGYAFEHRVTELPTTKAFSPYIYVVSTLSASR
jgi:SAM-dependent methyltransferase